MSDSKKVLIFGSFTEDETLSWMKKEPLRGSEKPVAKIELQFGSLNFEVGKSCTDVNNNSNKSKSVAENLVGITGSPEENRIKTEPKPSGLIPQANTEENGSIHGTPVSISIDDVQVNGIVDSYLDIGVDGSLNQFSGLALESVTGSLKESETNGNKLSSSLSYNQELQKGSNGHVTHCKDLLPRGIINSGNLCFLNSTVQALLSCSPFVLLLQDLRTRCIPKVGYSTLNAFAEFISHFDLPNDTHLRKKDPTVMETGRPFSPVMFESVLKNFTPDVPNSMVGRPRQEDAQEFLSFVMYQMHDELLKLEGHSASTHGVKSSLVSSAEEDEWETVGPKNKSAVTRTQNFIPSELSDIFGGQLRSMVKARGNKASATVQPFLLLHLDIYPDAVHTIEDALRLYSAPETLEGYRGSLTGKANVVEARKSVKIQKLPKILILHLMRFGYGSQGSTKLHKPVHFPLKLMLGRELLVSPYTAGRGYELVATITHHGREPSKGHYTADARYQNGQWLRLDDASVFFVGTKKVLHDQAYVLFYEQM